MLRSSVPEEHDESWISCNDSNDLYGQQMTLLSNVCYLMFGQLALRHVEYGNHGTILTFQHLHVVSVDKKHANENTVF